MMRYLLVVTGYFELLFVEGPLEGADPVDEQGAVEVIEFVLDHPGVIALRLETQGLAVDVLGFHPYLGIAGHVAAILPDAEAALFVDLLALALDDFWVGQHDQLPGCILGRDVNDAELQGDVDLRGGQAHARGVVHGFGHIGHQLFKFGTEIGYRLGRVLENGKWVGDDLS